MSKFICCKSCGAEIAKSAKACPQCGAPNKKKMGCLSIFLCVIVIFVALISIAAILGGEEETITPTGDNISTNGEEIVGEAVVIDDDQMKVTYQKVVDGETLGMSGIFYLWLKIENKTDVEVVATLSSADIDGESVSIVMTGVPLNIRPGNSGATGFIFTTTQLSIESVKDAEKVTFKVVLRDAETYDTVSESDLVTVKLH